MSSMIPFNFEGADVRVVDRTGEPWFVGKDVAAVLGYANPQKAVRDHCKTREALGVNETVTPSLDPQTVLIPERDVYRLIMRSNLPSAERFEEWVVGNVLPTIRKTGSFGVVDPMKVLSDPAAMRGLLLTYTEKVILLEGAVANLAPKADALDRIATADGSLCITDAAKALQVRPKDLFDYLKNHNWIYRRAGNSHYVGYQPRVNGGDLEHKVETVLRGDGTEKITEQVRVTPKGLTKLAALVKPILRDVSAGEAA